MACGGGAVIKNLQVEDQQDPAIEQEMEDLRRGLRELAEREQEAGQQ